MWQAPSSVACDVITGYDVLFADTVSTSNSSVVQNLVLKDRDQLFHVVRESDLPRQGGAPTIQVAREVLSLNSLSRLCPIFFPFKHDCDNNFISQLKYLQVS